MKTPSFAALLFLAGLMSCQHEERPVSVSNDLTSVSIADLQARFKGSEPPRAVPPSSPGARKGDISVEEMLERSNQLMRRLNKMAELATIPKPKAGELPKMSLNQVHREYLQFLNRQQDDSNLISMFKQTYAPLILNEYGLLNTKDYNQIFFYLNELISAPSVDFKTMTLCVAQLQRGHYPKDLSPTIDQIVSMAKRRYELEQSVLPHLISTNETLRLKQQNNTLAKHEKLLVMKDVDGVDMNQKAIDYFRNSDAKTCIEIFEYK